MINARRMCNDLIRDKLGWGRRVVSRLHPAEIGFVLAMIKKHDKAECRLARSKYASQKT